MVPEAPLETTQEGIMAKGEGWYVINAREARWRHAEGRGAVCELEGEPTFTQLGLNLFVLGPGESMAMYHWEVDQEDFLVVAGEAILIVEGEERPLRAWDFVHCASGTSHVIVGRETQCVVIAVGSRQHQEGPDWGGYPVEEAAARYGASADEETTDPKQAYARVPRRQPTSYRDGWLPDDS